ncbi:hypothetical protein [Actinacidiphila yanglinensis]|uniref:hypothetical protein n=1 Tax=Actinacidiphila yanglinensis TaxID=310779 RepID=UPI000CDEFE9B|nr:hypothetical protein [Actinacidiphila yanglinensis]
MSHPCPADAARPPSFSPADRMLRGVACVLLALVPAGYLAVAADQSHNVAAAREIDAEQAGLVDGVPSATQQAVYQTPVPAGSGGAAFFEANTWAEDTLYVRFTTTRAGLAAFLRGLGAGPADLRTGRRAVSVPAAAAPKVPWTFPPGHRWAGMTLAGRGPRPSHRITVNLDDPDRPVVFVMSVISFGSR